jgi:hypothetical protein
MADTDILAPVAPTQSRDVFTPPEAADYLSTEERTLKLWRQTLGLPHIRISQKTIRYRRCDLDAWLAKRRVALRVI